MMSRVAAQEAFGGAVAAAWGTVGALAFVVMVIGVVVAATSVAFGGRWV